MDASTEKKTDNLTDDDVARYLRNHPGFFLKHEDLLAEIKLSQDTGKAVSLTERQVNILRERNMEMRSRLSGLLENAQRNDVLFEKTKALVLALVEAKRADELSDIFCTPDAKFRYRCCRARGFWQPGGQQFPAARDQ